MFRNSVGLLGRSLRIAQRQGTLCARAFLSDAPPTPGPRPYAAAVVPAVTWTSQGPLFSFLKSALPPAEC